MRETFCSLYATAHTQTYIYINNSPLLRKRERRSMRRGGGRKRRENPRVSDVSAHGGYSPRVYSRGFPSRGEGVAVVARKIFSAGDGSAGEYKSQ